MATKKSKSIDTKKHRDRAEQIDGIGAKDILKMTIDDVSRLVQELEVHRVQLELQNEESRRIQEELQISRDRYLELYDYAPAGYFTIDGRTSTIIEANLVGCDLLKIERGLLLKTKFTKFIDPEYQDNFHSCRSDVACSRIRHQCELKMHRSDGSVFWADLELAIVAGNHEIRISMLDITPTREAEQVLSFHSGILDSLHDAVVAVDTDFNITAWNEAATELYGWTNDEVMGKNTAEILRTKITHEQRKSLVQKLSAGEKVSMEVTQFHKNGNVIEIEANYIGLKDDEGKINGYSSSNRDITERKRVEAQIETLSRFPEENPFPVLRIDKGGTILFANASSQPLLDYWHCEKGMPLPQQYRRLVTRALRYDIQQNCEVDCAGRIFSIVFVPIKYMAYVNIYGDDVTNRRLAEKELQESERDLLNAQAIAHIGSWRLDIQHNRLLWSDETHRIFGIPRGTPMTYETFISSVHPEDREYVGQKWDAALKGEPYKNIEHRIIVGDKIKWVRENAELEFGSQGIESGFGTAQDITARKQVEDELRVKDFAMDSASSGIAIMDMNGVVTYMNWAGLHILNYGKNEILGKHAKAFFADKSEINVALKTVRKKGAWQGEMKATRRDGSVFDVYIIANLVQDVTGKPLNMMASFLNISDRKRAENALKESEQRFRAMADSSPFMIWVINAEGENQFVNKTALEFFGTTPEQMQGLKWQHLVHPDDSEAHIGRLIAALREHKRFQSQARFRRADGKWRWVESIAEPRFSPSGEFIGMVGYSPDITERKIAEARIEELLEYQGKRLQQSEANFQFLIENMKEGLMVVDKKGYIHFANPAAQALLNRGSLIGTRSDIPVSEGVIEIEVKEGQETKYLEFMALESEWIDVPGYLVTIHDITFQKQAADNISMLSHRLAEVQEKERRQIGHELHDEIGGALTAIKITLAKAEKRLGEKSELELQKVNSLIEETMDQVSNLSLNMRPDILDDFGLVEALKWYFDRYTGRTGIKVYFKQELPDEACPDAIKLIAYRVIQESLTNVARYAGVDKVTVKIKSDAENLYIAVEDRGRGFDPEQIDTTSLGISGMQDRAFLAGGKLTVTSSPGTGTRIDCELPLEIS